MTARHLVPGALLLAVAGCDKSTRAVADTTASPSSGVGLASGDAAGRPLPVAAPPGTKQGPVPDDPMIANVDPMPLPPPSETKPIATANNAFAFDWWARKSKTPGNLTVSPASVSIALAMTWLGAKGETSSQIKKAMHFEGTEEATGATWGKLATALTTPPRYFKLRIANRLFGEKTYTFEPSFLDKTQSLFRAPFEPQDFKKDAAGARARINGWVEEKTEKRIVELLPGDAVDDKTRLVLVNAIYFLADWAEPFEPSATSERPFSIDAATSKAVATMRRSGRYPYAAIAGEGVKLLELPYKGGEVSMLVALPDKKDGLPALERAASATRLDGWRKALVTKQVDVALPRFEMSPPTMSIGEDLAALGMPLAFDRERADFSGIARPPDARERLHIGKVFHKAFVKVDEKGTEAAAATAVVMAKGGGMPEEAIPFQVDHPFLFFLLEKSTGLVLFMGRVADPSQRS